MVFALLHDEMHRHLYEQVEEHLRSLAIIFGGAKTPPFPGSWGTKTRTSRYLIPAGNSVSRLSLFLSHSQSQMSASAQLMGGNSKNGNGAER